MLLQVESHACARARLFPVSSRLKINTFCGIYFFLDDCRRAFNISPMNVKYKTLLRSGWKFRGWRYLHSVGSVWRILTRFVQPRGKLPEVSSVTSLKNRNEEFLGFLAIREAQHVLDTLNNSRDICSTRGCISRHSQYTSYIFLAFSALDEFYRNFWRDLRARNNSPT